MNRQTPLRKVSIFISLLASVLFGLTLLRPSVSDHGTFIKARSILTVEDMQPIMNRMNDGSHLKKRAFDLTGFAASAAPVACRLVTGGAGQLLSPQTLKAAMMGRAIKDPAQSRAISSMESGMADLFSDHAAQVGKDDALAGGLFLAMSRVMRGADAPAATGAPATADAPAGKPATTPNATKPAAAEAPKKGFFGFGKPKLRKRQQPAAGTSVSIKLNMDMAIAAGMAGAQAGCAVEGLGVDSSMAKQNEYAGNFLRTAINFAGLPTLANPRPVKRSQIPLERRNDSTPLYSVRWGLAGACVHAADQNPFCSTKDNEAKVFDLEQLPRPAALHGFVILALLANVVILLQAPQCHRAQTFASAMPFITMALAIIAFVVDLSLFVGSDALAAASSLRYELQFSSAFWLTALATLSLVVERLAFTLVAHQAIALEDDNPVYAVVVQEDSEKRPCARRNGADLSRV
ncbi:hypothetical protein E5Q_01323 [Mixia osmundae IAM 14324]|uniref:Uncharacterized protein n=1 Tax=Mixia osmundae (strain CBS 9802 / IAM 14324 / JCM 22182 / KY 12970) TaxID=764103 RepID=G7DVQ9_MIXOS|nr:hypothetical protein E5Q_01323 [Mixia osmundae IAM 14324]